MSGQRYYGNSKLIRCSGKEITDKKEFNRIIRVNESHLFLNAMLFIQVSGSTFKLKENEGSLQLNMTQKQHVVEM